MDYKDVAIKLLEHTMDGPLRMKADMYKYMETSAILLEIGAYACKHDGCNGMACQDVEADSFPTNQTLAFFFAMLLDVVVVEDWRQHVIRPRTNAFYLFSKDGTSRSPHLLLLNSDGRILFMRTSLNVSLEETLGTDGYNTITEFNSQLHRCDGMRMCTECVKHHDNDVGLVEWDDGALWKGTVLKHDDDTVQFLRQPCELIERALKDWEIVADPIIEEFAQFWS